MSEGNPASKTQTTSNELPEEGLSLKVAVLQSSYEGSSSQMCGRDPDRDPARFLPGHQCETVPVKKATAVRQIQDLQCRQFDVVVNLCGPEMEPFGCDCGVVTCRHTIRPTDFLLPQIRREFAGHVSDFVSSEWECRATDSHVYSSAAE